MNHYRSLNVKDRYDLIKTYRKGNPNISYKDIINDFNSGVERYSNGGNLHYLQPTDSKLPVGYRPGQLVQQNPEPSTKYATSIGGEQGEPAYLIPTFKQGKLLNNPVQEFRNSGDVLGGPFDTYQEADKWEKEVRHPYVEQGKNIPSPYRWWGKGYAQGGSIPTIQSNPILQNIYTKYPAFKNMGEVTIKADTSFTRKRTGIGDIEYYGYKWKYK